MTKPTNEQQMVLDNQKKKLVVSASAGSGKTFVLIEYISKLVCEEKIPIKRFLILTFTKAAAGEMRERLNKAILAKKQTPFLLEQLDDLPIADISTIDSFCEKIIKRNLNKTSLDENFKIIDEEISLKYKNRAFEKTLETMKNETEFEEIYFAFKKNKSSIFQCLQDVDNFVGAIEDKKDFLQRASNKQSEFFENSEKMLNDDLRKKWDNFLKRFNLFRNDLDEKYEAVLKELEKILSTPLIENFKENIKYLTSIELPSFPRSSGGNGEELKLLKKDIKDFLDDLQKYNYENEEILRKAKDGLLAKSIIKMYQAYKNFYVLEKEKIDALDFADLEEKCLGILKDKEVLTSLQDSYDYIFIDEYQDTNRLQEAIVKPIAEKGKFIAVGDPKQGIYGFRNATMEIMNNDIEDFQKGKDSQALFLKGNFRSDKKILDFVNKIFENIMTIESVGIDYKKSSMLEGLAQFKNQDFPAVMVDIVKEEKEEKENTNYQIYSVKEAVLEISNKNKLEIDCICARIDEILQKELYFPKEQTYRKCDYKDIAVLFRGRGPLMDGLAEELSKRGVSVVCDGKNDILEEGEIKVLLSLFKIAIGIKDEIALTSVMMSNLGGFSPEEMAQIREIFADDLFNIFQSKGDKLKVFCNMVEKFSKNCQLLGVYKSLEKLFVEKHHFAYLLYQTNGEDKLRYVLNFMNDILSSNFNFDLPSLIVYFENGGGKKYSAQDSNGNSITLTTIHATKGLEYPIVFLCGAGEKLEKVYRQNYILNKDLTLATLAYDNINNIKATTPNFEACKLLNKRKEFIDEIMIFYVALTRAKNQLCIIGSEKTDNLLDCQNKDVFELKNYLQIILHCFGDGFAERLFADESLMVQDWKFSVVSDVQKIQLDKQNLIEEENTDKSFEEKLKNYLGFCYPNKKLCLIEYKNSVTSILNLEKEEEKEYISNQSRQASIDEGVLHHLILKKVDFDNIDSVSSLVEELKKNNFSQEQINSIDKEPVYQNVLLLKEATKNMILQKEKPFVMKCKLSEISSFDSDQEVLVQGIIDLFGVGENIILIDYKWTNEKRDDKLVERYGKQLKLYKKAIEKAYNKKVEKMFIFSLKFSRFIEIN